MTPMTGRPLAIALTCMIGLLPILFVGKQTGLEVPAIVSGVIAAMIFWLQCYLRSEEC
jgi:hypothetical protein